jgi:hypothetical protein
MPSNWTFRFFTLKISPKPVLARDMPKKTKNSSNLVKALLYKLLAYFLSPFFP